MYIIFKKKRKSKTWRSRIQEEKGKKPASVSPGDAGVLSKRKRRSSEMEREEREFSVFLREEEEEFLPRFLSLLRFAAIQHIEGKEYVYMFFLPERERKLVPFSVFEEEVRRRYEEIEFEFSEYSFRPIHRYLFDVTGVPFRDTYILPAVLRDPRYTHAGENILCSHAVVLDLDFHGANWETDTFPEDIREEIQNGFSAFLRSYPAPSLSVFSGRGLQMWYVFSECLSADTARDLAGVLLSFLEYFFPSAEQDTKASGSFRIFRMPFSINTKSNFVAIPLPAFSSFEKHKYSDFLSLLGFSERDIQRDLELFEQEQIQIEAEKEISEEPVLADRFELFELHIERGIRSLLPAPPDSVREQFVRDLFGLFDFFGAEIYKEGQRQTFVLGLAGILRHAGVPFDIAKRYIGYIVQKTGDEEPKRRIEAVVRTYRHSITQTASSKLVYEAFPDPRDRRRWARFAERIYRAVPGEYLAVSFLSVYLFSAWEDAVDILDPSALLGQKWYTRKGEFSSDPIRSDWLRRLFRAYRTKKALLRAGVIGQKKDRGYTFSPEFAEKISRILREEEGGDAK